MTETELSMIADIIAESIRDYVANDRAELTDRIQALESREASPGRDGRDVDMDIVRLAISGEVIRQVAEIPRPKDGAPAPPVDMVAVRSIIDDSVLIAVEALPKAKDGRDGADGIAGETGPAGPIGQSGINGKDGKDGRDAPQVEILSTIDETRSYARGTFARYHNGLIRSFRETEAITGELEKSGWEVIVSGPTFEIVQRENLRSFDVIATDTNGKQTIRTFMLPVVIDQGVFKDGVEYVRGDATTWDGSSWICQAESTKAKPGTVADWRLSVKRGSAGKDFRLPDNKPNPGPVKL